MTTPERPTEPRSAWQSVDPTYALIGCPDCEEQIRVEVTVQVAVTDDAAPVVYARAEPHPQPVWDHVLERHGPGEDESWTED